MAGVRNNEKEPKPSEPPGEDDPDPELLRMITQHLKIIRKEGGS